MTSTTPVRVGLLGATGMVGQQCVLMIEGHPWFRLAWLGASERSAGRSYAEAARWVQDRPMPEGVAGMPVEAAAPAADCPELVFSAMDASVAGGIERAFARAGHFVVSNSRNHRLDPDVPLVIPEVNPDHLELVVHQRRERGWPGAIVTNPNCSTITLTMALAPLRAFGIRRVLVTTLQAVSGAGYPGVAAVDMLGNVVPFIGGEEEKLAVETCKLLGERRGGRVEPAEVTVSAHCNRVPTVDGHLVCASVELEEAPSPAQAREAMAAFRGPPQEMLLPSALRRPVRVAEGTARPQPRRDAMAGGGMAVTVGRVRECPLLGLKFAALGHNTIRGAAGAAVLNAEVLMAGEWLAPDARARCGKRNRKAPAWQGDGV
ncbi:MAG: aspartate-semialdehyde dehydrogenase [Gemmatimonadota bacterium]|nr:aspartate-semialdehyde dehydrogenase [Acidobacteriota bacterium]MDE2985669.1 aspartate-semialdehyde dehydrogenase [Gemmatimonadota bacterium]